MNPNIFKTISYGLFIVSAAGEGRNNGYIANTVFQLTAEPAKFGISCNKDNFTASLILKQKRFSVSVLSQNCKRELINKFGYRSGKSSDKFDDVTFIETSGGVPVVTEGSVAWMAFELLETIDMGTHYLFVGLLKEGEMLSEEPPLTYAYFHEVLKGVAPKNAPTYISKALRKEAAKQQPETKEEKKFQKYECMDCGWIYDPAIGDPDNGIPPGTLFEALPDDWTCPDCGAAKSEFEPVD